PSRICCRISGTQRGHSESVSRGQPSGGLVFSQLFKSGLSLHFGTNDGFWPIRLSLSNTNQAAPAAYVRAFSAYLIGLCMLFRIPPERALKPSIGKGGGGRLWIVIKTLKLLVVWHVAGLNGGRNLGGPASDAARPRLPPCAWARESRPPGR